MARIVELELLCVLLLFFQTVIWKQSVFIFQTNILYKKDLLLFWSVYLVHLYLNYFCRDIFSDMGSLKDWIEVFFKIFESSLKVIYIYSNRKATSIQIIATKISQLNICSLRLQLAIHYIFAKNQHVLEFKQILKCGK